MPPPLLPVPVVELPAMVLFVIITAPLAEMPPPHAHAKKPEALPVVELPKIVLF
jgi:hypothetical protein